MAKVYKSHKSGKKYAFQKKKINLKTLLIALAVVIVAAIGLKIAYDDYVYGEFEVAVPASEQLNNIADNWTILNTHTDKFLNYYSAMGYSTDGTDGNGNVLLVYAGNETVDEVTIEIIDINNEDLQTPVTTAGAFGRTTLTNFIDGVAPWGQTAVQVVAQNGNMAISIFDADTEKVDDAILAEILAEIEAVIAQGPVVVEKEPAEVTEEAAETTETTESTESAE